MSDTKERMDVKRWDHTPRVGWEESSSGDWVKSEDYDALALLTKSALEAKNLIADERDAALSRLSVLEGALKTFDAVAKEAARLNDADHVKGNSIKAHKLLMAMAGMIPGYRPDIDAARAALAGAA